MKRSSRPGPPIPAGTRAVATPQPVAVERGPEPPVSTGAMLARICVTLAAVRRTAAGQVQGAFQFRIEAPDHQVDGEVEFDGR